MLQTRTDMVTLSPPLVAGSLIRMMLHILLLILFLLLLYTLLSPFVFPLCLLYMVIHYMYALLVVTLVFTLMMRYLGILLRIRRIPPLVTPALLPPSRLLIVYRLQLRTLIPLLMILYFPLSLYSCSSYTHLQNHYIVLGTPLTLRNVVGRKLGSLQRILLRSELFLATQGIGILSFSLFNSRILQILQIPPPLIARSGNVLLQSMYHVMLCQAPH